MQSRQPRQFAGRRSVRHKVESYNYVIKSQCAYSLDMFKTIHLALKLLAQWNNLTTAKEVYLLSGKVICGECGSRYNGMNRPARDRFPQYTSYRCSRKNGSLKCTNSEIKREVIELFVLDKLANYLF